MYMPLVFTLKIISKHQKALKLGRELLFLENTHAVQIFPNHPQSSPSQPPQAHSATYPGFLVLWHVSIWSLFLLSFLLMCCLSLPWEQGPRLSYSLLCLIVPRTELNSKYKISSHIHRKACTQKWLICKLHYMIDSNHYEMGTQIW